MTLKSSLLIGLFVILSINLLTSAFPVHTKSSEFNDQSTNENYTGIRLTMKSFNFPNAKNNQCFRVAYLMELPQEMVDMLNSNQTFSVDQLGLPTIPMTSGNKLPMMNMFENFDMAFVRSCLDSLSQHMNASMPEFEVIGGQMAQLLGLKPVIVRVENIEPVESGYLVTKNLCFQSSNTNEKPSTPSTSHIKIPAVETTSTEEPSFAATKIYTSYDLRSDIEDSSVDNIHKLALPLTSGDENQEQNSLSSVGWPEIAAALVVFMLIISLCGCFCYC